jgi:two-component system capsular synthesis sensor histidine kinase RcsC
VPRKTFALSERYYRRMLYGCAVLLSIAIVTALLFFVDSAYEQFRERQVAFFVNKREQIKSEVDRPSARVTQFALMYGRLQRFYAKDFLPVRRRERVVSDGKGSSLSHENLTVVPFPDHASRGGTGSAAAGQPVAAAQAGISLADDQSRRARNYPGWPDLHHGSRFPAISPPLSESEKRLIENQGASALSGGDDRAAGQRIRPRGGGAHGWAGW